MDTGLFVSGAMDGLVKLWDTNALEVVLEFDFKAKVESVVWSVDFIAALRLPYSLLCSI